MSVGAELTSVASTLDELAKRVSHLVAGLKAEDEDRYGTDLREVERTLGVANRRLARMVSAR